MKHPARTPSRDPSSQTVRSEDGTIAFTLWRATTGVFVERVQLRRGRGTVVHSTMFTDGKSFERWCDADTVRFEYPLVHVTLKRNGTTLLGLDE